MAPKVLYGIYGVSGHGRETMPLARAMREAASGAIELVFIDDNPPSDVVNGHRVLTYQRFLAEDAVSRNVNIAIGDSRIRERLAEQCCADRLAFFSVQALNVVIGDDVSIGEGSILSPFVLLTSNIRIGRQFHANMHTSVAHDCVIGDYVTLAPGVRCNGNVRIDDHAYVGSGAVLRHGRPGSPIVIGRAAVVGMGAVVTRSVPPGATVVGNPARLLDTSKTC